MFHYGDKKSYLRTLFFGMKLKDSSFLNVGLMKVC